MDLLGQTGGVLVSNLFGTEAGFYDASGKRVSDPPYTGGVCFKVAGASNAGWNGDDDLVAKITFQIIKQPQSSNGETTVNLPLGNDFTDLLDVNAAEITHDCVQGTLTIASTPQNCTLTVNVLGNGVVTRTPSNWTYPSALSSL
jgi:hypothetical protein